MEPAENPGLSPSQLPPRPQLPLGPAEREVSSFYDAASLVYSKNISILFA